MREAWRTYLRKYNHGRGVIFVSHSQGSFVLRKLIAEEVDGKPAVRKRMISALLLGGNVTVKKGSDRGGDFKHIRACRSRRQLELRDRVLDLQRDAAGQQPVRPDHRPAAAREVLCTNPAALGGGAAKLSPVYPTKPFAPSVIGAEANAAAGHAAAPEDALGNLPERRDRPLLAAPAAPTCSA